MRLGGGVEALPQLDVLDRLLVGGTPAVLLPAVDPPGGALEHVLAVGVELHHAGPLQRLEARDRAHQLHLVVGRRRIAARQLPLPLTHAEDGGPATRSRVAAAGAVGEQLDFRLAAGRRAHRPYSDSDVTLRWKRSLARYSFGSLRFTRAPGGVCTQSKSRVSMKRSAEPRASVGSALRSASLSLR